MTVACAHCGKPINIPPPPPPTVKCFSDQPPVQVTAKCPHCQKSGTYLVRR